MFGAGVSFTFFPSVELDDLYIEFKTKPGTTMDKTKTYADNILKTVDAVINELEDSLKTDIISGTEIKLGPGSHKATIDMFLTPPENRGIRAYDIVEKIRNELGDIPDVENLIMGVGDPFGRPLAFALLGNNGEELEAASEMFARKLKEINGVAASSTDYEYGPNEINFTLKEKAKSLGLNNYEIFYQVRQAFFGTKVQDLQTDEDEMKLWIRYDERCLLNTC